MAINKKVGDMVGVKRMQVTHAGPARSMRIFMVFTLASFTGHRDPAKAPDSQVLFRDVQLPEAFTSITTVFQDMPFGGMPAFPSGATLDVNLSIGKPSAMAGTVPKEGFATWYSKRDDDDWNDDVYKIMTVTGAGLGGNPTYY